MVYKLLGKVDVKKLIGLYKCYTYMTNQQIYNTYIGNEAKKIAIAKRKSNGELIKISTGLLGYINSPYKDLGDINYADAYGYTVRWEDYPRIFNNFEDEWNIIPLKDIAILDSEELANIIKDNIH